MKIILIMTTLLVTFVCFASESKASDADVNEQYAKAKQISLDQSETAEAKEYFGSMASFWERNLNRSARQCQGYSGSGVELILKINEAGVVEEIVASPWNKKSACYAKIISGKKAPPPPEHPFFLSSVLP